MGRREIRAPLLLSVREVAAALGVTPRTINRRVLDGTLHSVRLGKVVRIPAQELDSILAGRSSEQPSGARST
jgi:excisionase family DNA binding protein